MKKHVLLILLVLIVLLLAGCKSATPEPTAMPAPTEVPATAVPAEEPTAEPAPEETAPMSGTPDELAAILGNLSYGGLFPDHEITLTDGLAPYDEGDGGTPYVQLIDRLIVTGDLDADGAEDALAFLVDYSTGSGDFVFLTAVLDVWGDPAPVEALMLGDGSPVKSLSIDGSQITVDLIGLGPDDQPCCPTWNVRKVFGLENQQLVELTSQELDKVSLDNLSGTSWQLINLNADQEPALPDAEITLSFENGKISGSGGCNTYNSDVTGDAELPPVFTAGPIATTRMACDEPLMTQETAYLERLAQVTSWRYDFGDLALTYQLEGEDTPGELLFIPTNAEMMMTDDGAGAMAGALWSNPWQWVSFTNPAEQFDVEMPASYQLTFNEDGTLNLVADCNTVLGSYTDDAGALSFEFGPMTLVACPAESRGDQFVQLLMGAARYFYEDGNLYIDLMADGGTLEFAPVGGTAAANTGDSTLPADLTAQLDAFLQSQVYSEGGDPKGAAPGLILYVQTPDGVYLNSAGVSNLDDGTPMESNGRLEIGSNTKSMTIVLLMQLVEEGLISLDDPLSQYLPDQAALFENGDQITIRQLAQHTAGLYDYADNIMAAGVSDPAALEAPASPDQMIENAAGETPYFAPGAQGQWHYSNTGYALIGMILESLTGEKVADLYQTRIFDPLGMESAIFLEDVPQAGEIDSHGYWWNGPDEIVDTTNWNGSQGWVAGSAAMTAEDLAKYGQGLAAGELFQNPDTLQEMLTWEPAALGSVGGPYGLGLIDFAGDGSVWGHEGQTLGFQSLWFIDPANETIVVGLTNSAIYKAGNLLNVRNILEGNGALPVSSLTLLPMGLPAMWQWTQFVSPMEATDIDEAMVYQLMFAADQTVTFITPDCGSANGAYTVDGAGGIDLTLDGSTLTCEADSLSVQAVQQLNEAVKWQFNNGRLLIDLPVDGGTFVFKTYDPFAVTAAPVEEETQKWHWVSLMDANGNETAIDAEGTYILSLLDELFSISTGCRAAVGNYETDGTTLTLTFDIPEKTDESCAEGPSADQFYEMLQNASTMASVDGRLVVALADGSALVFEPIPQE